MAEITDAELRRLRKLETRAATTRETLADVRAKRDQFKSEATAARRELRALNRDRDRLEKQVDELVAENAVMSDQLAGVSRDIGVLTEENQSVRATNEKLATQVAGTEEQLNKARAELKERTQAQARVEKQLAVVTDKLEGNEAPELTPDQLSHVLGRFIESVGSQTGLEINGTKLRLKVGFTGRAGGAFVVPSAGTDPNDLPELHDIELDLTPAGLSAQFDAELGALAGGGDR